MWVKGNGNVGIGTDNPTSKLTVDGSIRAVTGGGSQYLEIDHLNTSIAMNFVGSGGMRFQNSGTTQMTLTNAGNLGIGATSPQAMLHVDGNSQFDGDSWFDGNVGIGTGSPNQKLHVHNGHIEISNNNDPVLLFRDGGDNRMMSLRYTRNDDQMEFRNDAGSTVMAIEYWGKVGLGTIYPDEHLHIYKGDDPTLKLQSDGNDEVSGRISLRQDNETGMDIYYDGRSGTDDLVFESYSRGTNNGRSYSSTAMAPLPSAPRTAPIFSR